MDCDFNAAKLLSYDDALHYLIDQAKPVIQSEMVSVFDLVNRVIAQDITSPLSLPPYDNSAMDGYALNHQGVEESSYTIIDTSLAGHPAKSSLAPGQAARIMTGAQIPQGTTTVVMQENVERSGDTIHLQHPIRDKDNIRFIGEDIQTGQTILQEGSLLSARDAALLSACGLASVPVYRQVNVALFSTGDELVAPGETLKAGQLYDSNRPLLLNALRQLGVNVTDFGILADDPETIRTALTQASANNDIIITSGGVSVGDADYIKQILDELGDVNFWKVAMKPGKPVAFGYLGECAFIGLPGNPVSSAVTFDLLAKPFIKTTQHDYDAIPKRLSAVASSNFKKRPGRMDFQRGVAHCNEMGEWVVATAGKQGSAMLFSLSQSNCYVALDADSHGAEKGDNVTIILY